MTQDFVAASGTTAAKKSAVSQTFNGESIRWGDFPAALFFNCPARWRLNLGTI